MRALALVLAAGLAVPAAGQVFRKDQQHVKTVYTDQRPDFSVPVGFTNNATPTADDQIGRTGDGIVVRRQGRLVPLGQLLEFVGAGTVPPTRFTTLLLEAGPGISFMTVTEPTTLTVQISAPAFSGDLNDTTNRRLSNGGTTDAGAVSIRDSDGLSLQATDGLEAGRARVLRALTSTASLTELALDDAGTQFLTVALDTAHGYRVDIVARGQAGLNAGKMAFWCCKVGARNVGGVTALSAGAMTEIVARDVPAWSVQIDPDDPNDRVAFKVQGDAGTTVRWVARVLDLQVQ